MADGNCGVGGESGPCCSSCADPGASTSWGLGAAEAKGEQSGFWIVASGYDSFLRGGPYDEEGADFYNAAFALSFLSTSLPA